jgi:hypothetical protein
MMAIDGRYVAASIASCLAGVETGDTFIDFFKLHPGLYDEMLVF